MTDTPRKFTADELIGLVVSARRRALKALIDTKYGGLQSGFVADTGMNQGEVSGLLSGRKHFGEKKARAIELISGLPYRSMDKLFPGNVVPLDAREPDVADQVAAIVRTMTPPGQYVALGTVQQLAKQYQPAENVAS